MKDIDEKKEDVTTLYCDSNLNHILIMNQNHKQEIFFLWRVNPKFQTQKTTKSHYKNQ